MDEGTSLHQIEEGQQAQKPADETAQHRSSDEQAAK